MGCNSPISFLKNNLQQSNANKSAQVKSQEGLSYKPKYKNLRDAYEEFKALKQGKNDNSTHRENDHQQRYVNI